MFSLKKIREKQLLDESEQITDNDNSYWTQPRSGIDVISRLIATQYLGSSVHIFYLTPLTHY